MTRRAVLRAHAITRDVFHRDFVATATPVVLSGLQVAGFAASWEQAKVAEALGERKFWFKRSSDDAHPNFRASTLGEMFAREQMTFRDFFARISEGPVRERARYIFTGDEHYLARTREGAFQVNPDLEPLWRTVVVPRVLPGEIYSSWAWFSGKGAHTWLHYDNNGCHNLNLQLHGSKRCVLLPPDASSSLEFFEPGGPVPAYNCSRLDPASAAGEAALGRLPALEAVVNAGELLYIPAHWIHAFWHEAEYNANVNFWWKPGPEEQPFVNDNAVARRENALRAHMK